MIVVNHLSVQFAGRQLFGDVTFMITPEDCIGLVGRNGSGKSTLLKVLAGKQVYENGDISKGKEVRVGYLPQDLYALKGKTVYEETRSAFNAVLSLKEKLDAIAEELSHRSDYESGEYLKLIDELNSTEEQFRILGGDSIDKDVELVLMGLGFVQSDFNRMTDEFSGGWQMRIELAKLLLQRPELLLLDEPTNHLDIESITWLEKYLQDYTSAIILVSHDKAFLDNVTNRTVEIVNGGIHDYKFSYSKYLELKSLRIEHQESEAKNQERVIKQMKRNIERFRYKKDKAKFAQTLIRKLDKMEKVEIEQEDLKTMKFSFSEAPPSGKIIFRSSGISKSYGTKPVFENIELDIQRGERIAFVGKNGEGKTTMSKILAGVLDFEGELKIGHNLKIGYYAQDQADELRGEETVFEVIDNEATGDLRTKVRGLLGAFLFSGEDIYKKTKVLSGGERSRLTLARMLLQPVNLLILDEPTNHLDILTKQVLKKALLKFNATLIVVSHDRDFLDGLTDKVFEFKDSRINITFGGIYDFLKARNIDTFRQFEQEKTRNEKQGKAGSGQQVLHTNKEQYENKRAKEKEERRLRKKVENCEKTINRMEKELAGMETQMADSEVIADPHKLQEIVENYDELKKRLEEKIEDWEAAEMELEEMNVN